MSSIIAIVLITELLLSRTVIGRLRQFVRAVKDAGQGNLDARAPAGGRDEISEWLLFASRDEASAASRGKKAVLS